ncbi:hypothetical protein M501DRAFT_923261, partial [Patellaria atrata CBS 101060]
LNGPAMEPPPGVIPNLDNPPNKDAIGYGVFLTCICLSSILVAIRLYAKIICTKLVKKEDYLVVVALGVFASFIYLSLEAVKFPGMYVHMWDVRLKDLSKILYVSLSSDLNAISAVYGIATMILKVAILLQWVHTFVPRGIRNSFFWISHFTIWFNIIFYTACTIVDIWGCTPREKSWNLMILGGTCVNKNSVRIITSIVNFISDFIILVLPQKVIWELQMTKNTRIGVCFVFAVGVIATICGGMRMRSTITYVKSKDQTYTVSTMSLWYTAEITSGFLVFCIPAIPQALRSPPLLRRL